MFEHVLIGVDFSPCWERLQRRIEALQAWGVERMTLVHVLSTRYPSAPPETHRAHYEQRLAAEAEVMRENGLQAEALIRVGEPGQALVTAARTVGADLILIGTVGHGCIREFFFGSTALDAAGLTDRPLWLEPVACEPAERDGALLLATDGSSPAQHAEVLFLQLAPRFARAVALAVVSVEDEAAAAREHLVQRVEKATNAEVCVLSGEPTAVIAEQAAVHAAALVILGQRGRNPLQTLLLGSTAEAVCRRAHRPILLVPPRRS